MNNKRNSQSSKDYLENDFEQDRGEEINIKDIKRNKGGWLSKIPIPIKAIFIKFWFAGAIYFFLGWGIAHNTIDQLDIMIALGLVSGLVTDIIVNTFFAVLDDEKNNIKKFIMFPPKKFYSVFVNMLYGTILSVCIAYTYTIINLIIIKVNHLPGNTVTLGAEPLLYGAFFVLYDLFFLTIRNLIFFKKYLSKGETENV